MTADTRNRWLGLAMLSLGVAMIIVDLSIVNVAIPVIIEDLGIDLTTAQWINTIYSLVFAALLVTLGRLGDIIGRRRVYLAGLTIFALASLLAGLAWSGEVLLAARFLQGIGGAAILPATLSIITAEFRGSERAIAFGIWGSVIGGMAALGPLIGGWLTTDVSWHWAFLINLPIAAVAFAGTLVFLAESRDPHTVRRFDFVGAALSAVGFAALVFGLIEGYGYGWWAPSGDTAILGVAWPADAPISIIPIVFAISAVALGAFAWWELRLERLGDRSAVFRFSLFGYPGYRWGNLAVLILSLGEFGLLFVVPLFLQGVVGYSAFDTGLTLLALAIGAFVAGPSAALLAGRIGAKWVVVIGMALEAVGILWIGQLFSPDLDGWTLVPPLFVYGVGVGLATAQLTNVALAQIPRDLSGVASGGTSTLRQVGSALGIAILGTVLAIGLNEGTRDRLAEIPQLPPAAVDGIATAVEESAGQALGQIRQQPGAEPVVEAVAAAFVDAGRNASLVAAGFVLLGLLFSLRIPNDAGREQQEPDPEPESDAVELRASAGG